MLGKDRFGGPNKWDGYEIVMHAGSEHTVDGKRYDFELQIFHTVHVNTEEENGGYDGDGGHRRRNLAAAKASKGGEAATGAHIANDKMIREGGYFESAVSILFSVEDYYKGVTKEEKDLFNEFFDDLKLEETNPKTDKIHFGKLMEIIDWSHRWAY